MNSKPHPLKLISLAEFRDDGTTRYKDTIKVAPYHELIELVTGGRGWVRHQGEWVEIGPGDLLWHSPGDESIGQSDPENPYRCLASTFRVENANGMGIARLSKWPDINAVHIFAKECVGLIWNPLFDRTTLCNYVYARLLFQVRLHELSLKQARYPGPVAAVIARIENVTHCTVGRIADLAREVGWSVPHLHAEFRKHTGITPRQMLIEKRLQMVKDQLATTTTPLKQIAIESGFYDISALTRAFKIHTGMTPSEFRGNRKKEDRK